MKGLSLKQKVHTEQSLPISSLDQGHNSRRVSSLRRLCRKRWAILITAHQSVTVLAFILSDLKYFAEFPSFVLGGTAGLIFGLNVVLTCTCLIMDPGIQPRKTKLCQYSDLLYYMQHREVAASVVRPINYYGSKLLGNFCKFCHHFKHSTTRHCSRCNQCIVGFNHHCSILGCCVGARNYLFYFCLCHNILIFYAYIGAVSQVILVQQLFFGDAKAPCQISSVPYCLWITAGSMLCCFIMRLFDRLCRPFISIYVRVYLEALNEMYPENLEDSERNEEREGARRPSICRVYRCLIRKLLSARPPSLLTKSNEDLVCSLDYLPNE